ncbi:MAG TPA: hypothetical protein VEU47_05390 [Candidatus Cybelea sp.]|nr:hypothetical protein [Candidatus Cybelea sp.]
MSSHTQPWSVKGIEPEAREAAKIAARRANMTLGQWLTRCIGIMAAKELGGDRGAGDARPQLPALPVNLLLDAIQQQTVDVKAAIHTATAGAIMPVATRVDEIAGKMRDLDLVSQRLAEAEAKAQRAALVVAPLERTLTRLADRMSPDRNGEGPEPAGRSGLFRRLLGGGR